MTTSKTPTCSCDHPQQTLPVITNLITSLASSGPPAKERAALTQLTLDAVATQGLFVEPGHICDEPNPPRWCWYAADLTWMRTDLFAALADKGLDEDALGVRLDSAVSFAEFLPFALRAAASRKEFEAVDATSALDATLVLQAVTGSARITQDSWWAEWCRKHPTARICQVIARDESFHRPPVPELVAINVGYSLGLLDERVALTALRRLAAATEQRSAGELSPGTADALLQLLGEDAATRVRTQRMQDGEVGMIDRDSWLCTRENWRPWCIYVARRPFLRRFVDSAWAAERLSSKHLRDVMVSAGIVIIEG